MLFKAHQPFFLHVCGDRLLRNHSAKFALGVRELRLRTKHFVGEYSVVLSHKSVTVRGG